VHGDATVGQVKVGDSSYQHGVHDGVTAGRGAGGLPGEPSE
jgi:hypothetical protein